MNAVRSMSPEQTGTRPQTAVPEQLSPSLLAHSRGSPQAYELKFLLPEELARMFERRLRPHLAPDVHSMPDEEGAYATATIYGDTVTLDVYHRRAAWRRTKHRVRRYGQGELAFLERKWRRGDRVRKRRSAIPVSELGHLSAETVDASWSGAWFQDRLQRRAIRPVVAIGYIRTAYMGASETGPWRLTFDRDILGRAAADWQVSPVTDGIRVWEDRVVCECKFRGTLPAVVRQVLAELQLTPGTVSKYRMCVAALGLEHRSETVPAGHAGEMHHA